MALDYRNVVFAYGMEDIFSVAGVRYLLDHGPHGLHAAFPGGAADPVPQLDGSLLFDGGDYLSISGAAQARFYQVAPTGAHTWLFVCAGSGTSTVFSCWTAAIRGLLVLQLGNRMRFYQGQNGVTAYASTSASSTPDTKRVMFAACIEAAPRGVINEQADAVTWGVGAFGTTTYDSAIAPRIGMYPDGSWPFIGRLSYLCLMKGSVSSPDLAYASRLLAEGVKPFCWRRP